MAEVPPLLLIDKPKGITSFDVIRQLRKKTGIRKFGHAGTLDPLATGLLLIGANEGTKLLSSLIGLDKEYEAEIILGERRSTGDMEGSIVEEKAYVDDVTDIQIVDALHSMQGELSLPVSAYSAIKKDGVAMYKRARQAEAKGDVVTDVPIRTMQVHEAELMAVKKEGNGEGARLLLTVRFRVGSGTYIRSLAEELGSRLGYPATIRNLRRTKVGEYRVDDALTLETFR